MNSYCTYSLFLGLNMLELETLEIRICLDQKPGWIWRTSQRCQNYHWCLGRSRRAQQVGVYSESVRGTAKQRIAGAAVGWAKPKQLWCSVPVEAATGSIHGRTMAGQSNNIKQRETTLGGTTWPCLFPWGFENKFSEAIQAKSVNSCPTFWRKVRVTTARESEPLPLVRKRG